MPIRLEARILVQEFPLDKICEFDQEELKQQRILHLHYDLILALFPEGLHCDFLPCFRFVSNELQIDFLQLDESESVWIENLRT